MRDADSERLGREYSVRPGSAIHVLLSALVDGREAPAKSYVRARAAERDYVRGGKITARGCCALLAADAGLSINQVEALRRQAVLHAKYQASGLPGKTLAPMDLMALMRRGLTFDAARVVHYDLVRGGLLERIGPNLVRISRDGLAVVSELDRLMASAAASGNYYQIKPEDGGG